MSEDFSDFKNKLQSITKKIIKATYNPKPETRCAHLFELISVQNEIVTALSKNREKDITKYDEFAKYIRGRVIECLKNKLRCKGNLPTNNYVPIDVKLLEFHEEPEKSLKIQAEADNTQNILIESALQTESDHENISDSENRIDDSSFKDAKEDPPEMAITTVEFLRLCAETIPTAFNGDPLHLPPFIKSIELLSGVAADTAACIPLLLAFIKTRLSAKALEHLQESDDSVAKITTKLTNSIKPENDKIIRGKMAALRADKSSLHEFSKHAERLADSLKRALIIDGIPSTKANTMTVEETVAMCKNNARSDYVKSVLASTSFTSAKEVVAKYIIETGNDKADKQVLAFRALSHQHRGSGVRYNERPNFSSNRRSTQSQNSTNNGPRQNFNRFRQSGTGFRRYNNGNNNSDFRQSNNSRPNFNNNGRPRNYSGNQNSRNVRFTASENSDAPQRALGEPSQHAPQPPY